MDTIATYRDIVKQVILRYAQLRCNSTIENQVVAYWEATQAQS